MFDGVSNEQRDNFIGYLSAMQAQHDHPFLLPMMLLDHLREFYVEYRNRNEMRLHRLETELRMTRGETQPGADDQEYWGRGLQANTIKTNQLLTSLIYLERRINFLGNLANNLASNLDIVNTFDMSAEQKTRLTAQSLEMKAHIKTISSLATDQANQVTCLQKRAQALLNVIYILITQRDTRTNIQIARSAKQDSSSMTTIAILTMFFLPGTFISSYFGMNLFGFQPITKTITTSREIWVYWALTIPLTLVVLGLWILWLLIHQPGAIKELLGKNVAQEPTGIYMEALTSDFLVSRQYIDIGGPCRRVKTQE